MLLKIADILIRVFSGSFLLMAIPGLIYLIREDMRTMKELKERGLI